MAVETTEPTRTTREPMSRERVLRVALDLADRDGLRALTMRRLARELGVEAMTLYYYVANKDEILDGIVDLVLREIELRGPAGEWKPELRRTAISAYGVLLRHRWAGFLWWRRAEGADRMRGAEFMLRALAKPASPRNMTYHGYHVLVGHILGFTLQAQSFPIETQEELAEMASKFLEDFPVDEYPFLAEHIRQHVDPGDSDEGAFAFGLDLILDGLERMRDRA